MIRKRSKKKTTFPCNTMGTRRLFAENQVLPADFGILTSRGSRNVLLLSYAGELKKIEERAMTHNQAVSL